MSNLGFHLEQFHFLRPWFLLLIPMAVGLWWALRARVSGRTATPAGLAPHLAAAMEVGANGRARVLPVDGVILVVILGALASAGPTWSRIPNPLVAQTAPLAIVLKVSTSMEQRDIAPSRLERAKHKVLDLLDRRAGARTALVAYAGSAHRVVPPSEDPEVLKPFLAGLSPAIMPRDGENATFGLELARTVLASEQNRGAILFVSDTIDRADVPAFEAHIEAGGEQIILLAVTKESNALQEIAGLPGVTRVELTPDATDVIAIERRAAAAYRDALDADERQKWEDRGYILAWPAALLVLLWFRRGWTMRWGAVLAISAGLMPTEDARADGLIDWFLTPDQQGRIAWEDKRFGDAADLFTDPAWKGYALYRAGRYPEAIDVLSRLETADAALIMGLSHIRSRGYRPAIEAFKTSMEREPEHAAAAHNLEIALAILTYVEDAREASDTGEEGGVGADEIVFDNEEARGTEIQIEAESPDKGKLQSAEQWMRMVDTRTADFLRSRFQLEFARGQQ